MRVLTVGNMYPPHHYGGYELVWRSAVQHLRERGHEVRVLTTDTRTEATDADPPGVYRDLRWHLRDAEFQRLGLRDRIAMVRHNHAQLERHLAELKPDVVGWWSMGGLNLTMLETVRRRRLPAVSFIHDDWLDYGLWADPWLNLFSGRRKLAAPVGERLLGLPTTVDFDGAAAWLFGSERTRRHAVGLGHRLGRTGVAQLGIDTIFLDPAPPQEWEWRLLYVGRLDPRKGVDTAVEAMAALPAAASLELIGGWDSREEHRLRALADEHGVDDRVRFAGQLGRAEIADAYARADVALFPVRWEEPWGLVPLEAMAKGRPVAATGRGGSAEYLRDGENCVLFEAGDPAALVAALQRLATEPGLRSRLREEGIQTAARFTEPIYNAAVERALADAASIAQTARPFSPHPSERPAIASPAMNEQPRAMRDASPLSLSWAFGRAGHIAERVRRTPVAIGYFRGPAVASRLREHWVKLRNPHANIQFGDGTYLGPGFSLHMPFGGTFVTGEGVEFRRNFRAELAGAESRISVGPRTVFTYDVLIQCATSMDIGADCGIGQSTLIVDGNHQYKDLSRPPLHQGYNLRPLRIGDGAVAWSKNTIIADLGDRAILGSGAVATKPVPAYSVAVGIPARVVDYFGPEVDRPGGSPDGPHSERSGEVR